MNWLIFNQKQSCPTPDELMAGGEYNYRMLFNNTADAIVIADLSTKIIDANPAACRLFGYAKKELLKLSIRHLHPANSIKKTLKVFTQLAKGKGFDKSADLQIITKKGKIKFVSAGFGRIKINSRDCLIAFFRDITEKKESEVLYKTLAEMAHDSIYLVDRGGRITYVNEFGAKQFNAQPIHIVGKSVKDLFPPAVAKRQKANLNKVFRSGQHSYREDLSHFAHGDVWLSTQLTPVRDQSGRISNVMGFSRDITETKKNEITVKNYVSLLDSITNTSSDGILVIDRRGRVSFYNEKFLELWKIPQKLAKTKNDKKLLSYVVSQLTDAKEFLTKVNYLYKHPANKSSDTVYFKDGRVFDRLSLPQKIDGKIVGRVWRFTDVTKDTKIQKSLVKSEQKYRRLFEAAKDGILILNVETGEIEEVNPYLIEMLGYGRDEFLQKKLWEIGLFKDIMASKKSFEILKKKKYVHYDNLPLRTKSGKPISVEFVSNVYNIGRTKVVQCNIRDITARHQTETKLVNSEDRLRAIYENSPIPIVLVGLDNKFISANPAAVKFWGYSEDQLEKLTFADITHPDEVKRDIEKVKLLLKGKISVYSVDKRYIRKDKKIVYGRVNATLIKNNSDKPLYFLTVVEDITQHKIWEREIKQSEERYSILVERSNDAVILIQGGIVKYANPAIEKITGMVPQDVIGKPMVDFIAPQYKSLVASNYKRRMQGERVDTRYEFAVIDKHGKAIPVETNSSVVVLNGQPADMAILRDISKAKEIDRLKSEFVSMSSHQLRTPLTGIKWFGELLLKEKIGKLNQEQRDFVEQIYHSNERMIKLVNDLLDVSHLETGRKFTLNKKPADLRLALSRAIEDQTLTANKKKISMIFGCGLNGKIICVFDFDKIVQMLNNLISNAIKYSPDKAKITFDCQRQGDYWSIAVTDQGYGIPQYQQHRIFERFFRADNIRGVAPEGTGLGLYIARGIVEAHGGRIWFDSKENKGTTFYFTLPVK
ncbi:MAG: PAS domain S-box protein [Patescibacteria group bacterium]|jgi:PAS domain S-box-containing protein